KKFRRKYKDKFFFENKLNDKLSHLIESGVDIFLMPSKFEPCGLNQIYSLKYGTLPIVRKTGGLADTVIDIKKDPENGTGFVFEEYSSEQLLSNIKNAVSLYNSDKESWKNWQVNGMEQDFSWDSSALEYLSLYTNLSLL
ncbi:MAG: glycosyltransferase, partial [Calditrichia bacterium]|nr:glycosyltransferase [Calditrichia bacterium]